MTICKFTLPAIPAIAGRQGATDHFLRGNLADLHEYAATLNPASTNKARGDSWNGGLGFTQAIEAVRNGHLASVGPSDDYLVKVETLIPAPTARKETVNDIAGGCPNVPAFLSGNPLNMRRRASRPSEFAPLAIVADMAVSAMVPADQMARRGAAILALVRTLAGRRPVQLFVGTGLNSGSNNALWQLYEIDTAPLDLARAAFMLGHVSATRTLQYGIGFAAYDFTGQWPYCESNLNAEKTRAVIARALPEFSDVLVIPAAHGSEFGRDADPVAWIADHVAMVEAPDDAEAA